MITGSIIGIEPKTDLSRKIKKYIENNPKVLEEYLSNRLFTTTINTVMTSAKTDDEALQHLIEMAFSSIVIYSEMINAFSEVAGEEACKKAANIIKSKIEYFKD